jgi:hypothetical protein
MYDGSVKEETLFSKVLEITSHWQQFLTILKKMVFHAKDLAGVCTDSVPVIFGCYSEFATKGIQP